MQLRGCHKRMICIKSADSALFCEAFFVLREDCPMAGEGDMINEANRILEEHSLSRRTTSARGQRKGAYLPLLCFLFGAALATGACFLIACLL